MKQNEILGLFLEVKMDKTSLGDMFLVGFVLGFLTCMIVLVITGVIG